MNIEETELPGVLEIQPRVFGDARGFFLETWRAERYEAAGIRGPFVQDNVSRSGARTLRGLHLQFPEPQGKLVWVLEGSVYDVAVDVRVGSPTFGRHVARMLDAERKNQLFIPAGFAHGFQVVGESALFVYKCTAGYRPGAELTVAHDDPALGIEWPVADPILSDKDRAGARLAAIPEDRLPRYEVP